MSAAAALPHLPLRGFVFGCVGAFLFTAQDASFKWLGQNFSIAQIIFLRSIVALLLAAAWAALAGGRAALRVGRPGLFGFSLCANLAAWFCFYAGLNRLPLTAAICVFFLTPVVIAAMSAVALKERLSWKQAAALACGFAGVFVITNPLAQTPNLDSVGVLLVLASAVLWSVVAVSTRALEPSMTIVGALFYSTLAFLLVGGGLQAAVWQTPTPAQLAGMLALGAVSAGAQCCMWAAYRSARAALVATAEYSALLWAAWLGWLLWDEQQSGRDLAGIALILLAGAIALWKRPQKTAHHP